MSENPGAQKALSRTEYDQLIPEVQGFMSYMQAAWNSEVPEDCPYPEDTEEHKDWDAGQRRAVIEVVDLEE